MSALKESLVMSLSLLPENALVGLVTFGTMVNRQPVLVAATNKTIGACARDRVYGMSQIICL